MNNFHGFYKYLLIYEGDSNFPTTVITGNSILWPECIIMTNIPGQSGSPRDSGKLICVNNKCSFMNGDQFALIFYGRWSHMAEINKISLILD